MKRLMAASACAVALVGGAGATARAAQPPPSPDLSTAVVCDRARTTMLEGIKSFADEMDWAGVAATSGDVAGADKGVRQSGLLLVELGGKLRRHAATAPSAELRKALESVARELEKLGGPLTGVGSLQNFDTKRLEVFAGRAAEVCQK